jgi:uncharacterized protein YcbK (DUF882 family)
MRYFDISDFDSPDKPGSGEQMDKKHLEMLDDARHQSGCAFVITSGVRSKNHNRKVGGKKNSSHLRGFASDIAVINSARRMLMIKALLDVGFNRIGVGSNFIHVDNDPDKISGVMWTY